jgi:acyl-coenzyme A thioesterase PaaI-like protein
MRPAAPRQHLYCTAYIYRLTERIAFFNAQAFNDDPSKPIAVGTGTFMLAANASVPDILGSPFTVQDDG